MFADGQRVGRYTLKAEIGQGGMGHVFLAQRSGEQDLVAVKVMRDELVGSPDHARRFLREARALAAVRDPHLVEILEAGSDDGTMYIAMRYVAGDSLDELLSARGPLPLPAVQQIVDDVAAGLDALHQAGITHRDVKPSNIMVRDDRATLMDLGLVKSRDYSALTTGGQVIGTLDYLAPELIRGADASPSSDVYALGCVTYEALTGMPLFSGGMFEVGLGHLEKEPPNACLLRLELPLAVAEVLGAALAKDPARRPESAPRFAILLRAALG